MSTSLTKIVDIEFDSGLNRALNKHGARKFSLLMAMMEQNVLTRIKVKDNENTLPDSRVTFLKGINPYPPTPIAAEQAHWQLQNTYNQYIQSTQLSSARLWQCMHPSPLSINNDPKKLAAEVIANCDFHTQKRIQEPVDKQLDVDETQLFEVLEQINASHNKVA